MKISIDGILGTAQKINSQKELEENNPNKKRSDVKTDSVSIGSRINTRLDAMETEFREVQSSLTRNQIIRDGIEQLRTDLQKGAPEQKNILDNVTFEGNRVLRSFIGESITEQQISEKMEINSRFINDDVTRLKKLQVELDNITASDLVGQDRLKNIVSNVDTIFTRSGAASLENISTLRPDAVMRLIK
ncbi:MAG TPA: hypothetical protein PKX40_14680 [Spirochaetota bacterium]|nr:hypothetical protein [Spirochaetota bacterium]